MCESSRHCPCQIERVTDRIPAVLHNDVVPFSNQGDSSREVVLSSATFYVEHRSLFWLLAVCKALDYGPFILVCPHF